MQFPHKILLYFDDMTAILVYCLLSSSKKKNLTGRWVMFVKLYCNKICTKAINTEDELILPSIISSVMYCSNYTENAELSLFYAVTVHMCRYDHRYDLVHWLYEKKTVKWQYGDCLHNFQTAVVDKEMDPVWTIVHILFLQQYKLSFWQCFLCANVCCAVIITS